MSPDFTKQSRFQHEFVEFSGICVGISQNFNDFENGSQIVMLQTFQRFPKQILNFGKKCARNYLEISRNFLSNVVVFRAGFDEISSEFHENLQKIQNVKFF